MLTFELKITLGNAAFAEDPRGELEAILETVLDKAPRMIGSEWVDRTMKPVFDTNGNRVGGFCFTGKSED